MTQQIDLVGLKAEKLGYYSVQSEQQGVLYVYNDNEFAVVTPHFVWRLPKAKAEKIASELVSVLKDINDIERWRG